MVLLNCHFEGLTVSPASWSRPKTTCKWSICSSHVSLWTTISTRLATVKSESCNNTWSINLLNIAKAPCSGKDPTVYRKLLTCGTADSAAPASNLCRVHHCEELIGIKLRDWIQIVKIYAKSYRAIFPCHKDNGVTPLTVTAGSATTVTNRLYLCLSYSMCIHVAQAEVQRGRHYLHAGSFISSLLVLQQYSISWFGAGTMNEPTTMFCSQSHSRWQCFKYILPSAAVSCQSLDSMGGIYLRRYQHIYPWLILIQGGVQSAKILCTISICYCKWIIVKL